MVKETYSFHLFDDLEKVISVLLVGEVVFPQSKIVVLISVDQLVFHYPNTKKSENNFPETVFHQTNAP